MFLLFFAVIGVVRLFHTVPRVGLWSVIVAFRGYNHVLLEVYFTDRIFALDSVGIHIENTRFMFFVIKLTRQGFENTC